MAGCAAKAMGADVGAMFASMLPTPDPSRPDDRCWPWSALTSASLSLAGLDTPAPAGTAWSERASGCIVIDFSDAAAATQAMSAIGATLGAVAQVDSVVNKPSLPAGHSDDEWVIDPGDGKSASGAKTPAAKDAPAKVTSATSKLAGIYGSIASGDTNIVVPEPGSLTLMGTGLLGFAGVLRRKLKA